MEQTSTKLKAPIDEMAVLTDLVRQIGTCTDKGGVCALALNAIDSRIPFEVGFALLINPPDCSLAVGHAIKVSPDLANSLEAIRLPLKRAGESVDSVPAASAGDLVNSVREIFSSFCQTSLIVPLTSSDHTLGCIGVGGGPTERHAPSEELRARESFLEAVSAVAASALQRVESFDRLSLDEQKYRAIIERSPDGFMELDTSFNVTSANDAALRILECTVEQLRNGFLSQLFSQTGDGRDKRFAKLMQSGSFSDERFEMLTPGGRAKTINLAAWATNGPDGKLAHFQVSFRDVTARVRIEREIARRTEELRVLNSLATRLSYPIGVEKSIQEVCDEIVSLSGMENVAVFLAEPRHSRLSLIAVRNADVPLVRALERHPWRPEILQPGYKLSRPAGLLETVLVGGRTIVFEDAADPNHDPALDLSRMQAYGFTAGIVAPLRHGDETFGLLLVGSSRARSFTTSDRDLIENIALRLALSLRNKQLFDRTQTQIRELEALFRAGETLVAEGDSGSALDTTARAIEQVLGADRVTIFVDRDGEIEVGATSRPLSLTELPRARTSVRSMLDQGVDVVVREAKAGSTGAGIPGQSSWGEMQAFIGIPLVASGHKIGALCVGQRSPRAWTPEEQRLVRTFARQIAGLLHNSRLLRDAEDHVRELESVAELSALSGSLIPEDKLVDLALDSLRDLLAVPIVVLHLLKGDRFLPGRARGIGDAASAPVEMTQRIRRLFEFREPLVVDSAHPGKFSPKDTARAGAIQARALIVTPMVSGSIPVALLTVVRRDDHIWTQAEIRAVKTFANQLATGIVNIRLYQQERERAERLRLLSEFSQTCARMLEVKTLLQAVPALVSQMMRAPQVSIRVREGERLTTGTSYGYLHPELRDHPVAVDGIIEAVVLGHQPLAISDLSAMDPLPPVLAERMSHEFSRAALFLPLNARGESLGLLSIFDYEPRDWSTVEIQYAQTIANTVALSYSNVRVLEALKQERGDIEMTLNSVFSGVFTTDEEGNIQTWNRAAAEMTGWVADDMRGKNWVEFARVSGEYPDELVLEAMARQDVLFGIAPRTILTARGQEIPLAEAAAPLRDADGRIRGAVGAFWDRTRERQEEQARLDFLHEASHELRNSLTVVLAMAGLLRQADVKGATREKAIQVIGNQVDRIKGFSDRFLRFESEEFDAPLEQQVVDVCDAVMKIAEGLRAKYPDHPIQIVGQGAPVNADPRRLNTVLLNLLDNACKYSPSGTTVWLEVKNVEPNLVRVAVRNEGSPIPSQEAKDIFRRGHRGSRTGSEQSPGHGIGLWLAQTMLREMGGQICLDEAQTDGVTLYFTLQRTGVEHDERQVPNPDGRRRRTGPRRARRNS